MNSEIISASYSVYINKGAFALLLGSGISRTAGIPTGWEITLALIEKIALLDNEEPLPTPEDWYKKKYDSEPDYSDILERLTNTPEERLNLLKPYIEPSKEEFDDGFKVPTAAHRQIAKLVKGGYIKVIVTTNFDRLIENALKDLGVEPTVISNPNHVENTIPIVHSQITIIKINGDYLDTKFLNIKKELEEYDERLISLLRFVFENYGLITCGWSAKWDIALVNILQSSNKFRYSNYFTHLNIADNSLSNLCSFRCGKLLQIKDADNFFTELTEGIEALDRSLTKHPLTSKVVLARLKKYIVKEEHRITMHDLFHEVVEDAYDKINSLDQNGYLSTNVIKRVIDEYCKWMDLSCSLTSYASYWAKEYHYQTILNSIKRILLTVPNRDSYSGYWNNLSYFPALLLRYCCGISSIASGNIQLLSQLNSMKVKNEYGEDKLIIELANQLTIIEEVQELQKAFGRNYIFPMSSFLHKFLRPYFNELIPIESDFDTYFNYYEFLTCLKQFKIYGKEWTGLGLFALETKGEDLVDYLKTKYASEIGNIDLIQNGYFKDINDLNSTLDEYKAFLGNKRGYISGRR